MINELQSNKNNISILRTHLSQILLLPVELKDPLRLFHQILKVKPCQQAILESDDDYQITYQVIQVGEIEEQTLINGQYRLIKQQEDQITFKKKIKQYLTNQSAFLVLTELPTRELAGKYIITYESIQQSYLLRLMTRSLNVPLSSTLQNKMLTKSIHSNIFLYGMLDTAMLYALKFKLNQIYHQIKEDYSKHQTSQKQYNHISKLIKSEQEREIYLHSQTVAACKDISQSISGEYSQTLSNYQGSSLRGFVMTILNSHFTYLKVEYVNIINRLTYGDIRRGLESYDSVTLDGFLSTEQFNGAFKNVIEFLESESLIVLPQVHELVRQAVEVAIKKSIKIFKDYQIIVDEALQFVENTKDQCFNVVEDVVRTVIHEVYFNEALEIQPNQIVQNTSFRKLKEHIIWEVKKIGAKYFRHVIITIQDTIARYLLSKYLRTISNNLLKNVLEVLIKEQVSSQLNDDYIHEIQEEYKKAERIFKLYSKVCSNQVFQIYLVQNLEEKFIQEPVVQQPEVQRVRFRDRIKRFFRIGNPQAAQQLQSQQPQQSETRVLRFKQRKKRLHSPDTVNRNSKTVDIRTSLATDMIVLDENSYNDDPLSVAEWLQVTTDDEEFEKIPYTRLTLSLAKGIPTGLRRTIWQQITRLELKKTKNINYQSLKDDFQDFKSRQNEFLHQIDLDVLRTKSCFTFNQEDQSEMLRNVLIAYSNFDSSLGYTQGMNFITVVLIQVYAGDQIALQQGAQSNIELNSFLTLVMIMKTRKWEDVLGQGTPHLVRLMAQFDRMFLSVFPQLYYQMESFGFSPQIAVTHYIISILTSQAPLSFSTRILDVFLMTGEAVVMRVLMFMFSVAQQDILKITDQNQYFVFLKSQLCSHVLKKCEAEFDKLLN